MAAPAAVRTRDDGYVANLEGENWRVDQWLDFWPEVREPTEPFPICINDLNIGAVRMGAAEELVFLHWDFAGPNVPEWELAYVLKHWMSGRRSNSGTARALVDGYRAIAAVPALDACSFWLPGAIRDLLSDGFSVTKINRILAEL